MLDYTPRKSKLVSRVKQSYVLPEEYTDNYFLESCLQSTIYNTKKNQTNNIQRLLNCDLS